MPKRKRKSTRVRPPNRLGPIGLLARCCKWARWVLGGIGAISIYSVRVDCGPPLGLEFAFTTGPQQVEPGEKFDFKGSVKENVLSIDKLAPDERHPFWCSGMTPESPKSMISSKGRTFVVRQADIQIN